MTKDEALKMALEALEAHADIGIKSDKAITAIKEALAQPEQERCTPNCEALLQKFIAQRKPLTDEEIILIVADCASSHQHTDIHFARAIEAAHGIKGLV